MPIFTTFVMGSKETYFFNTPTHWAWHNLPADVEAIITKTPTIREVIELAIIDKETYFISYRDHDSNVLCKHYNLPNPLTEWLYASHPTVVRDLHTLSITLGPYGSYYAWDKASASWSNLPMGLEKAVLARLESQDTGKTMWKANGAEAPSFVSLGADGAYFMRTVAGGGCWDLKCGKVGDGREGFEGIRGSSKFLEDCSDFNGIAGVHLFPSHPNCYILVLTSGQAYSNLPECTWPDYNKMAPALPPVFQTSQPIPPMPHPPSTMQPPSALAMQPSVMGAPSYQQSYAPRPYTQPQYNCYPSHLANAPPNCHVQIPAQPRPLGPPAIYGTRFDAHVDPRTYQRPGSHSNSFMSG